MKRLLILCPLLLFFAISVNAQLTNDTIFQVGVTPPPATRAKTLASRVGETLVICDKVYSIKVVNDKIKSLNVGANQPDQVINVVLMGECADLDTQKMLDKKICFKGIISLRKGKPHMVLTKLEQIPDYKVYQ